MGENDRPGSRHVVIPVMPENTTRMGAWRVPSGR
jgi:hypothetical protein